MVHFSKSSNGSPSSLNHQFPQESFVEYYGMPLTIKGEVKGVLEVYHRSGLNAGPEWLNFLETLAGQTAIAIDSAQMFDSLERSNLDLRLAYDATIEGWSRAMDLRDKETEGHTQRVTAMTLELARVMGLNPRNVIHMRRGALLHDMGKLGIPDNILLKSAKLTDEEWEIMRQHPQFAFDMLSDIYYLKPSLDIPYSHHEKWDGTGYPRGLKEEEIPLPARIFAVADVWDALTSDRPYRQAWTDEQAIKYITEQSGKHFDPQVVRAFIEMMELT
jgi:HD-GYP domain-containing protein (c-di-GMP phosphodiesterase class II)